MASQSEPPVQLKGPTEPPPLSPPPQMIEFCHPHYKPPDVLFKLPKLDSADSADSALPLGVHHGTALLACQIVANNAFRGFLSTDKAGRNPISVGRDGILTDSRYWFIADPSQPGDNYPLVPRFEDWVFPHDTFQEAMWQQRPTPTTASHMPPPPQNTYYDSRFSGDRCIISSASFSVHSAHVVPKSAAVWFQNNTMEAFSSRRGINSPRNQVKMRHDIHNAWDQHKFALVPKRSEITVHVLDVLEYGCEFAAQWHNTMIRNAILEGHVADEYLFAKFAQAIFMLLKEFVVRTPSIRRIITRVWAQGEWRYKVEQVAGDDLNKRYSGGGTIRSTSASSGSRKRSHSQTTQDDHGEHLERNVRQRISSGSSNTSEEELNSAGEWYERNIASGLEPERGRPRERNPLPPLQSSHRERTVDTVPSLMTDDNKSLDAHDHEHGNGDQDKHQHQHDVHEHVTDEQSHGEGLQSYTLPPIISAKSGDDGAQGHASHVQEEQQHS